GGHRPRPLEPARHPERALRGRRVRLAAPFGGPHRCGAARGAALQDLTRRSTEGFLLLFPGAKPMQRSRVVGTGTYLPERVVTNDDLSQKMGIDTSDAWIRERTGIGARRIAAPNEATSDMATVASKRALEMAGVRAEDLDLIICGTVTADMPFPAAA